MSLKVPFHFCLFFVEISNNNYEIRQIGQGTLHKLTLGPTVKSFTSNLALFASQRCKGLVAGSRNASVICPIHHAQTAQAAISPCPGAATAEGRRPHISNVEGKREPRANRGLTPSSEPKRHCMSCEAAPGIGCLAHAPAQPPLISCHST